MSLNNPTIAGPTPDGSPSVSNPVQIGGVDLNGNVRKLLLEYSTGNSGGVSALDVVFSGRSSDAFGRGRVSEPTTLFDVSFEYDAQPLVMQTANVGSGSASKTSNVSSVTLTTGGTTSTWGSIFQSKQYSRYEPGKSQLIQMTGVIGSAKTNVRSQIGYYDVNNGAFFDQNNGIAVTVRSSTSGSPVDVSAVQANWNLDRMDGTGASGYKLDFSKAQIFVIDFQWLGYGRIRFGFAVNGRLVYCHQVQNSNLVSLPWSNTGCLPVRWEIHNTGTAGSTTTMIAGCASVVSEGGVDTPHAYQFTATSGVGSATSTPTAVRTPLVTISPKTTFNSITNRGQITSVNVSILCTPGATQPVYWELVYNSTLAGSPSFASVDPNSICNFDVAASGTILTITGISTSAGIMTITGAWLGGANNLYINQWIKVSGCTGVDAGNNGTFLCTASAAGSISLINASGTSGHAGTPVAQGGTVVASGLAVATDATQNAIITTKIAPTLDIAGLAPDTLSLCATGLGAGAPGAWGTITWQEIR